VLCFKLLKNWKGTKLSPFYDIDKLTEVRSQTEEHLSNGDSNLDENNNNNNNNRLSNSILVNNNNNNSKNSGDTIRDLIQKTLFNKNKIPSEDPKTENNNNNLTACNK
jgi:serine/threonine protein kinase HipA of HipAB toxin-antitoxin module